MSAVITIARSTDTSLPVHIDKAQNGLECNCICYKCNERLEAHQGKIKSWYFSHHNSNCNGSNETALHQYAKLVLFESICINTSKKKINYTDPNKEAVIDVYRSDVCVKYLGKDLHFEVVVHHDFLETEKDYYYKSNKINCIRIDLTDKALLAATAEEIKCAVIEAVDNKDFIFWNEDDFKMNSDTPQTSLPQVMLGSALVIAGAYLLKKLFRPSRRKRRHKNLFIFHTITLC